MENTRNTLQRNMVLQAVQQLHNHPTADEICGFIRADYPSISKGTVYRNLNLLVDQGSVRRVSHLKNSPDRFDFDLSPHYHFQCKECNQVFDVDIPENQDLFSQVVPPEGFSFESYEVTFTGLCQHCKKNK